MAAEHCHDCPRCDGYFTCSEDDCAEDDFCSTCSQGNLIKRISELEAELAKVNEAGEMLHAKYRELEAEIALKEKQSDAYEDKIETEIVMLKADNSRLREALKRLEWARIDLDPECGMDFCPSCRNLKVRGHASDCWLALELKEGE